MLVVRTSSPAETRALAAALAPLTGPGDLLLLTGDLGAGKTAFTQGFGRALGIEQPITSPTFALHRRYEGRRGLNHLDVYRLDQLEEVADLGLAELLESDDVTLIEWGDTILPALPEDYLLVRLCLGEDDDDRLVELQPVGSRWTARWDEVVSGLAERWHCETSGVGQSSLAMARSRCVPEPDPC
jgi:tRNA threonylcarbamoyladenosine biosynthesis protein TsaE